MMEDIKQCLACGDTRSLDDFGYFKTQKGQNAHGKCKRCRLGTKNPGKLAKSRGAEYVLRDGMKKCVQCEVTKLADQYYTRKGVMCGKCKACGWGVGMTEMGQTTLKARLPEYAPHNGQRRCVRCETTKPLSEFPTYHWNGEDHPEASCKACGIRRSVAWQRNNPGARATICARYSATEKGKANARKHSANHRKKPGYREYRLSYDHRNAAHICKNACERQKAARRDPIKGPKMRAALKERYIGDPQFNMAKRLRSRLASIMKMQGHCKAATTMDLLGCSWADFQAHIESQFQDGMSWENLSQWHLDHRVPLSSFNLGSEEEQRAACHFSNFQPLWAADNLRKSDRMEDGTRGRDAAHHRRRHESEPAPAG